MELLVNRTFTLGDEQRQRRRAPGARPARERRYRQQPDAAPIREDREPVVDFATLLEKKGLLRVVV